MRARAQCTGREAIQPPGEETGHYRSGPEPSSRRFSLTFGGTGCAPDKCICPLGKILTYKNLIYLLNFPVSVSETYSKQQHALINERSHK